MEETVFLNGRFLPLKEANIPISEPGFLLGFGAFETMRSYNNRIVYFDQHLKRIQEVCKSINIKFPYSLSRLKDAIKRTIKINNFKDAYVRLTLWKTKNGTGIAIITRKYKPYSKQKYRRGINLAISSLKQNENSFLANIKSTSRLLYELSYLEAQKKRFDGSVILNNRGYITEGSRSNIFFVKDNSLFTPSLSCGCLDGITRKVIFDLAKRYKIKIYEGKFSPLDLYQADEIFFTNSLAGIMPVASIEEHRIGKGISSFRITGFLMKKYNLLLKNGT